MKKTYTLLWYITLILIPAMLILSSLNETALGFEKGGEAGVAEEDPYDPIEDINSDNPDYARFAEQVSKNPKLLNELPPDKYMEASKHLKPKHITAYCTSISQEDLESIYNANPPASCEQFMDSLDGLSYDQKKEILERVTDSALPVFNEQPNSHDPALRDEFFERISPQNENFTVDLSHVQDSQIIQHDDGTYTLIVVWSRPRKLGGSLLRLGERRKKKCCVSSATLIPASRDKDKDSSFPKTRRCTVCGGSGWEEFISKNDIHDPASYRGPCRACGGKGEVSMF